MNPKTGLLLLALLLSTFSLPAMSAMQGFPECEVISIEGPCTPLMPSISQVSRSGTSITLRWNANSNYDYFLLGKSVNGNWEPDQQIFFDSASVPVQRGNTYAFRIAVCSYMHGCGIYATTSSVNVPLLAKPSTPSVGNSGFTLNVSWGSSAEATRYEVQTRTNGSWGSVVNRGSVNNYSIVGTRGSRYAFRARACDNSGCSAYSSVSSEVTIASLTTPQAPSTSNSGYTVTASWTSVSGASRYDVQVLTSGTTWSSAINKGLLTSHSVPGSRGNNYAFRVRACDSFGCTGYSSASSVFSIPNLSMPLKPTVSNSDLALTTTWSSVTGANRYDIQVRTNGTWAQAINTGITRTHTMTAARGSAYAFRVRACDSFGCSNYSTVSNALSVPTLAVAPKPTVTSSNLALTASWGAVSGASRYEIQVSTNGTWASPINKGTTRTHTITGARGSTYLYRVRACDSFGCSSYSTVSNALSVPTLAVPSTPTVVVSGLSLTASWGAVSGASRYDIQVGTNGTWANRINTGTTRSHSITGARGSTYTFRVRACDSYGCTAYSPVSNGVSPPDLAGPEALTIISSELNVELSWGAVVDAERYEIQVHSSGSWGSVINRSANRNYAFEGAVGASYKFRVRACDTPTCSAFSESGTITISQLSPPTVTSEDTSGGGARLVSLSSGTSGAVIRYTLDDSPVTAASPVYTHPLMMRAGIIRAKAYHEDWVASDERRVVLSLSGDPDSTVIFIHVDILGSVIGETDSEGKLIRVKEYKPFGERKEQQ